MTHQRICDCSDWVVTWVDVVFFTINHCCSRI